MAHATQSIYSYAGYDSFTWRQDTTLDAPLLEGPRNGSNLCVETTFTTDIGVQLKWLAVSGADFYVVQWCNNSSFSGPTLQAKRTANIFYDLQYGDDVRIGEEIHWRVMAFNSTSGAVSAKSEIWSFTHECPEMDGNLPSNQNQQPGGGGGSGVQGSACEAYNVKVEITGPELVFCCDKAMWHLKYSHNCEDQAGNAITVSAVNWELQQGPDNNHSIVFGSTNYVIVASAPDSGNDESEQFVIVAKVTLQVAGGSTFECSDQFRVTMDCDTGRPGEKPWLKARYAEQGLNVYTDPAYRDDAIGCTRMDHITGHPVLACTDYKQAIAAGPIVEVHRNYTPYDPEDPDYVCEEKIDTGKDVGVIHEARVHIALGCGLDVYDETIRFENDEVAGPGLAAYQECQLQVDPGCGLEIYNDKVRVKNSDLAGPGLSTYGECGLRAGDETYGIGYKAGCGLVLNGNIFEVKPSDLAGDGLQVDSATECGIEVYTGCGLMIVADAVEVNPFDLVGLGLTVGSGECNIDVRYGCGLHILNDNLEVNPRDLVGDGLRVDFDRDCAIEVNYGCGLEVLTTGGALHVKPEDLAGSGLLVDPYTQCGIMVDPDYNNSYYTLGCGLEATGADNRVLAVKPEDLAGNGLGVDDDPTDCQLHVRVYCGIELTGPDSDFIGVKRSDLMGPGLKEWDDCGFQVDCDYCPDSYYELGCGLEKVPGTPLNIMRVKSSDLAGDGLTPGLGECDLEVNTGCGLYLTVQNGEVAVDRPALMGPGLIEWGSCGFQIDCDYCQNYDEWDYAVGCGLEVINNQVLQVKPEDLAGPGLVVNGDCGLAVDCDYCNQYEDPTYCYYIGCGLTVTGDNTIEFDPNQVAGPGLQVYGDCGLMVDCSYCDDNDTYYELGCGLEEANPGVMQVKAADLAGSGLVPEGTCGLAVYPGCGLELNGDEVRVKTADLMGPGLQAWGDCGFQVDPTYVNNYADDCYYIGCGLLVSGGDTVEFDPSQVAGPGLQVYGDCGLAVDCSYCPDTDTDTYYELGCGLEEASPGVMQVKATDLAGSGLVPEGTCGLAVYPGCGLMLVGDAVEVNPIDLVGPGLELHGECGLSVDPTYVNSYAPGYTAGCGLTLTGTEFSVNPADLMGPGLIAWGDCGFQVDCDYCNNYSTGSGYTAGCGLTLTGTEFSVNNADLAGPGLTAYGDCGLQVDCDWIEANCDVGGSGDVSYCYYIGCGLAVTGGNTIEVDPSQLAGPGLEVHGDCGLSVDCSYCDSYSTDNDTYYELGCGLEEASPGVMQVKAADLAGSGLIPEGTCGLAIDCAWVEANCDVGGGGYSDYCYLVGCGLQISGNVVQVKNSDLAGPGLNTYGDCGLQLDCDWIENNCDVGGGGTGYYAGCGLSLNGNEFSVNASDLAGSGLTTEGDCGLAVDCAWIEANCDVGGYGSCDCGDYCYDLGCGLQVNGDSVEVNPADLAGDCLEPSGTGCELQVQSTLIEVVTDVYCENSAIYAETSLIRVLDCS